MTDHAKRSNETEAKPEYPEAMTNESTADDTMDEKVESRRFWIGIIADAVPAFATALVAIFAINTIVTERQSRESEIELTANLDAVITLQPKSHNNEVFGLIEFKNRSLVDITVEKISLDILFRDEGKQLAERKKTEREFSELLGKKNHAMSQVSVLKSRIHGGAGEATFEAQTGIKYSSTIIPPSGQTSDPAEIKDEIERWTERIEEVDKEIDAFRQPEDDAFVVVNLGQSELFKNLKTIDLGSDLVISGKTKLDRPFRVIEKARNPSALHWFVYRVSVTYRERGGPSTTINAEAFSGETLSVTACY